MEESMDVFYKSFSVLAAQLSLSAVALLLVWKRGYFLFLVHRFLSKAINVSSGYVSSSDII